MYRRDSLYYFCKFINFPRTKNPPATQWLSDWLNRNAICWCAFVIHIKNCVIANKTRVYLCFCLPKRLRTFRVLFNFVSKVFSEMKKGLLDHNRMQISSVATGLKGKKKIAVFSWFFIYTKLTWSFAQGLLMTGFCHV